MQSLAQQHAKLSQQLNLLKERQSAAAQAEQFEEAETWSNEIKICEKDLERTRTESLRVLASYEQMEVCVSVCVYVCKRC